MVTFRNRRELNQECINNKPHSKIDDEREIIE